MEGEDEDDGMWIKRQQRKGPAWVLLFERVFGNPVSFLESGLTPSDK